MWFIRQWNVLKISSMASVSYATVYFKNLSSKQMSAFHVHKNHHHRLLLRLPVHLVPKLQFSADKEAAAIVRRPLVHSRPLFPRVNVLHAAPTTESNGHHQKTPRSFESGAVERRRPEKGLNTLIGEWLATLHYEAKLFASKKQTRSLRYREVSATFYRVVRPARGQQVLLDPAGTRLFLPIILLWASVSDQLIARSVRLLLVRVQEEDRLCNQRRLTLLLRAFSRCSGLAIVGCSLFTHAGLREILPRSLLPRRGWRSLEKLAELQWRVSCLSLCRLNLR